MSGAKQFKFSSSLVFGFLFSLVAVLSADASADEVGERKRVARWAVRVSQDESQHPGVRRLANLKYQLGTVPVRKIKVAQRTFYLSRRLKIADHPRQLAVLYTVDESGTVFSRLLYRSLSGGSWRVVVFVLGQTYVKGPNYTQSTRLRRELEEFLEEDPNSVIAATEGVGETLNTLFSYGYQRKQEDESIFKRPILTFDQEVKTDSISPFLAHAQECQPGSCFQKGHFEDMGYTSVTEYFLSGINPSLEKKELQCFFPDFSKPPAFQLKISHSLLSEKSGPFGFKKDIVVEVFYSQWKQGRFEWHMAKDRMGRVWIDRLRDPDSGVTTYGTDSVVPDGGVLLNKPFEYLVQAFDLQEGKERMELAIPGVPDYVDITPVLRNLFPIRRWVSRKGSACEVGRPTGSPLELPSVGTENEPAHLAKTQSPGVF
ncbi:MAG: hypothetical protein HYX41_04430 [Bdellovibrio sp.]|nr:hypothetical protein [Bdellovibrio sp.]